MLARPGVRPPSTLTQRCLVALSAALPIAVACAAPQPQPAAPTSPGAAGADSGGASEGSAAESSVATAEPPPAPAASAATADAGGDGCATESETFQIAVAAQHARTKKGGFTVRLQSPALKLNELLVDTTALKGGYNCCVHTEVEVVSFECELPDGNTNGRVTRQGDDLVIDLGDGKEPKKVPIPCGSWLRFRGPSKDCEQAPS